MTKDEFLTGWTLLIAQPWGLRYARQDNETDRTLSRTQADFYYQEFSGVDGADWLRACQQYAKGTRWPSIEELRVTLRARPTAPAPTPPSAQRMTLSEFGEDLFEAIKLASRVQQLDHELTNPVLSEDRYARLAAQRNALADQARQVASSPTISDEDAAELVRQYSWLLQEQDAP